MKKVLVRGGAEYIGNHLVDIFKEKKLDYISINNI